jgi:predicted anti-sigma-YlaC factor YlaD
VKHHSHIRSLLLPWLELTLDAQQQQLVEEHLKGCETCREYFNEMSVILLPSQDSSPTVLSADPYVPTRIRAMAESAGPQSNGVKGFVARWVLRTVMFAMAVVFGIYMGERLSYRTSVVTDQNIITEYSESLEVGGIADRLQTIAQANTEAAK